MSSRFTRRSYLQALAGGGLATLTTLALASCGAAATVSSAVSTSASAAASAPATSAAATTTQVTSAAPTTTATTAQATASTAASTATTAPTTALTATTTAAAQKATKATLQLAVWQNWGTQSADPRTDFTVKTLEPRFAEEHPGLGFDLTFAGNGNAVMEKLTANVAAGTPPDVSFIYAQWSVGLGQKGVTIPLDDLMATDKSFQKDDFYSDIWDALTYQNKTWAFPQNRHPLAVFYRTDLFNRYDGAAPQTWTDFTQLIQRMTHVAQGQYATDEGAGDSNLWDVIQRSNGGTFLSADGTQVTWDSAEGLAALQYYADLYQKYTMAPPKAITNGFAGGQIAMTISGPFRVTGYLTQKLPVLTFPMPHGSKEAAEHINIDTWGIMKTTTARQEAAFTFVSWYASKPIYGDWAIRFQHAPLTKSIAADPAYQKFVADTPIMKGFLAPGITGTITPLTLVTADLTNILNQQVAVAVTGKTDALTALKQATTQANATIAQALKA
jgi:multiple sugar transport system substrate-binding protein